MKTTSKFLLTLLILAFFALQGFSQTNVPVSANKAPVSKNENQKAFTDANGNGICDNFEARKAGAPGRNFTDKNGDGICDNRNNQGKGNGNGCGFGHRHGQGKGMGMCGKGNQCRNRAAGSPVTNPQPSK